MCTAITYTTKDHYFGRNLDLQFSYNETVTITPRNYIFNFRKMGALANHYAIIGMAYVADDYPLYYDATNEKGLSIAGLNFPENADYKPYAENKDNITPFELIPWILGQCTTVTEAEALLKRINLLKENFSDKLPLSPLHWIIADKVDCIVVEQTKEGLKIFGNPIGVLTNSPPFDVQLFNLNNYINLSNEEPENKFSDKISLTPYSRGMGAMGLPGDNSSMSRFVRSGFVKMNSEFPGEENNKVNQFFHILYSVHQQRGCVKVNGKDEITNYAVCANADKGIYYFTTYENFTVHSVSMHKENLDTSNLVCYELYNENKIISVNG